MPIGVGSVQDSYNAIIAIGQGLSQLTQAFSSESLGNNLTTMSNDLIAINKSVTTLSSNFAVMLTSMNNLSTALHAIALVRRS